MKGIAFKPEEIKEITGLCIKRGLTSDIELSQSIIEEFDKQHTKSSCTRWDNAVLISCILRAGYTLGQRAQRAKARGNNK